MNCPKCGGSQLYVTDTRHRDCRSVRRIRKCTDCNHKFMTLEFEESVYYSRGITLGLK